MITEKHDLIVRFDEQQSVIRFFTPDAKRRDGVRLVHQVSQFASKSIDETAAYVGRIVLAHINTSLGTERFARTDTDDDVEGDVSFTDAQLLIDRLGAQSSLADLEAIDALLTTTADAGDGESRRYLVETWPKLREVFERRIRREPA